MTHQRMADGVSTDVYRITRGDERFYLRVLPDEGATFAAEVRAHQLALDAGCRVPEVLAYEPFSDQLLRSIMITAEIPGVPLTAEIAPETARRIVRRAGRDLARINQIAVDGFGWVDRGGARLPEGLTAEQATIDDLLIREYLPLLDTLPDEPVEGLKPGQFRLAVRNATELVSSGAAEGAWLAHGDLDTSHIFVDNDRYSGIIDFGEIRGMPWYYDLAHHLMHDGERLPFSTAGWLLDGYRDIQSVPANVEDHMAAMSLLIASRALARHIRRAPESQIVAIAQRAISREVEKLTDGVAIHWQPVNRDTRS